jgi:hypothetical protein
MEPGWESDLVPARSRVVVVENGKKIVNDVRENEVE